MILLEIFIKGDGEAGDDEFEELINCKATSGPLRAGGQGPAQERNGWGRSEAPPEDSEGA